MAGIRKTLCAPFPPGKQSGSLLCGVCAIRAKENEEKDFGGGGVENTLSILEEQRLRENMSADREEVNEWKLQTRNKTLLHMCDILNSLQHQYEQQQFGF